MNRLQIKETAMTPSIDFNASDGQLHISGRCLPDQACTFYKPSVEWFENYLADPSPITTIQLEFTYINTASLKLLTDNIRKAEVLQNGGKQIAIEWICDEDDEDMIETGEIIQSITQIPFHIRRKCLSA